MALTTLYLNTALIVLDLQKGIAGYPFIDPIGAAVDEIRALLDIFRMQGLPVVLVNVAGRAPGRTEQGPCACGSFTDGWTDFLPELNQQPNDIVVTKPTWGAFVSTDLDDRLKALGVTQVVATRVATSGGVEATTRQAYVQRSIVSRALDAMTNTLPEARDYSISNVFPRHGEMSVGKGPSSC
jgi:nicotinamidase-related amidase